MDTFSTLFPNPMDCYFALFQDAIFEHDSSITYVVENGNLKRRNRTLVLNKINDMAKIAYKEITAENASLAQCHLLNYE